MHKDDKLALGCLIPFIILVLTSIAGYITHLFWVFSALMNDTGTTIGQLILIVIGTCVPPFGVIHGFYLWFM